MYKLFYIFIMLLPITIVAAPTDTTITEFFWEPPAKNVDGSPLTDLAGFKIYCRTETTNYPNQGYDIPDPNALSVRVDVVVDMLIDEKYFCTATAYDRDGHESAYTMQEVSFLVVGGVAKRDVSIPAALPLFGVR